MQRNNEVLDLNVSVRLQYVYWVGVSQETKFELQTRTTTCRVCPADMLPVNMLGGACLNRPWAIGMMRSLLILILPKLAQMIVSAS